MTDAKHAALLAEFRTRTDAESDREGQLSACLNAVVLARKAWIHYVVLLIQYGEDVVAELLSRKLIERWDVTVRTEDDPIPCRQKERTDRRIVLTPLAAERLHVELDEMTVMTPGGPSEEAFWSYRVEIGSREDVQRPIVSPRYDREHRLPPFADLIVDRNRTIGGVDRSAPERQTRRDRRRQARLNKAG